MIAYDDEQGPLHHPDLVRPLDELAEPAVHHGDLPGVGRPHPEELAVGEVVVPAVDIVEGFLARVAFVVEGDVLLWRVPGLVRVVAVSHQEKRPVLPDGLIQRLRGVGEHPGGEVVFFAVAALDVGEVLAGLLALAEDQVVFSHPLFVHRGRVLVGVFLLAPDRPVVVKAPTEVQIATKLDVGVGHEVGAEALSRERLGHRGLPGGYGFPPVGGRAGRPGPHPRVDGAPGRQGGHRLGVGAGEQQALFGEGVEGGGLDPGVAVGADVVPPEGVNDHQDDVRPSPPAGQVLFRQARPLAGEPAAPGRSEQGRPRRSNARGPQEIPTRQRPLRFLAQSRPSPHDCPKIRTLACQHAACACFAARCLRQLVSTLRLRLRLSARSG